MTSSRGADGNTLFPPDSPWGTATASFQVEGVPQSFYWACRYSVEDYDVKKLYISESGCSTDDASGSDGRVMDLERVQWLRSHFQEARRALHEGLPLKGYFVWSLMDNFEWAEGYLKRFGIHFVDYETQERVPKASAHYLKEVIRSGRL